MELSILVEIAGAIGSLATAAALFLAWGQIKRTKELARADFEDGLNREYRDVISGIPVKALLGETLSEVEHAEALPDLYQYFDLSNTQAFLRQDGRVTDKTWELWRDGIEYNLSQAAFRTAWQGIKTKAEGSFSELRRLEQSGFRDDPKEWTA